MMLARDDIDVDEFFGPGHAHQAEQKNHPAAEQEQSAEQEQLEGQEGALMGEMVARRAGWWIAERRLEAGHARDFDFFQHNLMIANKLLHFATAHGDHPSLSLSFFF